MTFKKACLEYDSKKSNGGIEVAGSSIGNHLPHNPAAATTITSVKNWWKNQMECESSDEEDYMVDFPITAPSSVAPTANSTKIF